MRPGPWLLALALAVAGPSAAAAARITVVNADPADTGFNDPTPFTPVGGNTATRLGQARLNAFQYAANRIAQFIDSPVPIRVRANMEVLPGDEFGAVLGGAGPTTVFRDFAGAPRPGTWYVAALANKLAGRDLCPPGEASCEEADLAATFNSAVDGPEVMGGTRWYYGLDGRTPVGDIDFVTVVLHELLHGLGFMTLVELADGTKFGGLDDAYMLHLQHSGAAQPDFALMTDPQRAAAAIAGPDLHWGGSAVTGNAGVLAPALIAGDGNVQVYAPDPLEPGSSVSHFNIASTGDQPLMAPFYAGPNHDPGLGAHLLDDIGWGAVNAGTGSAAVALALAAEPDPALAGDDLTYTATVTNDGPNSAAATTLTAFLPELSEFVSVQAEQGQCTEDQHILTCRLGDLDPGAGAALSIVLRPRRAEAVTLGAVVDSTTADEDRSDNHAAHEVTVQAAADLALNIADSVDPVAPGQELRYTLQVSNHGPSTATAVMLSATLPAAGSLVSVAPSQGDCTPAGAALACRLGSLAEGASGSVAVVFRAPDSGLLVHEGTVSSELPDPDDANNTHAQSTAVGTAAAAGGGGGTLHPALLVLLGLALRRHWRSGPHLA